MFMFGAWNGVRLTGVRVQTVGLDKLDPARTYIFMSNHVSNLDPPITIPSDSAAHFGDGEEGVVQLSDSGPRDADGVAGTGGSRQSRRWH